MTEVTEHTSHPYTADEIIWLLEARIEALRSEALVCAEHDAQQLFAARYELIQVVSRIKAGKQTGRH